MRTRAGWSSTRADAGARRCPLEGGALALRVLQVDASDDELNPGVGAEFGVTGFPTVLGWAADVDDDSAEASKRGGSNGVRTFKGAKRDLASLISFANELCGWNLEAPADWVPPQPPVPPDDAAGMKFTGALQGFMVDLESALADALATAYLDARAAADAPLSRWMRVAESHRAMLRDVSSGLTMLPRGVQPSAEEVRALNAHHGINYQAGSEVVSTAGGVPFTLVVNVPLGSPRARSEIEKLVEMSKGYKAGGVPARITVISSSEMGAPLTFKERMVCGAAGVAVAVFDGDGGEELWQSVFAGQGVKFMEAWLVRPDGHVFWRGHTGILGDLMNIERSYPVKGDAVKKAVEVLAANPAYDGTYDVPADPIALLAKAGIEVDADGLVDRGGASAGSCGAGAPEQESATCGGHGAKDEL